jgi:amidase
MSSLHDLSALEQAAAIRKGEVSAVELAEHQLDRISRHNDVLGAFITVTPDDAIRRARAADRAVAAGEQVPPLHGVPIGIKDLHHTAGVRTTMGSALHLDFVPDFDDHAVALLKEAGANILGKTNVPEFGYPFHTENLIAPPARTPWDLTKSAGGSSGGAAAAVAGGLIPFAQGSDGGGSLRVPASVCGLYGIKPSRGRISNGPTSADVTAYSANGALTRTVGDAAAMLDAMVRVIPTENYHSPSLPAGDTFLTYAGRTPGRLRIGRYLTPCVPDVTLADDCARAWEHASSVMEDLGHEVVDIPPPFPPDFWRLIQVVHRAGQSGPVPSNPATRITPLARWIAESASTMPVAEYLRTLKGLRMACRQAISQTASFDALLTPTLANTPRPVGWFTQGVTPAVTLKRMHEFSPFTGPYNVTGQPVASIPLWWNDEGLPIGVMLAGRPFDEATLLSLSGQLEKAVPWRHRVPDIWHAP